MQKTRFQPFTGQRRSRTAWEPPREPRHDTLNGDRAAAEAFIERWREKKESRGHTGAELGFCTSQNWDACLDRAADIATGASTAVGRARGFHELLSNAEVRAGDDDAVSANLAFEERLGKAGF